MLEYLVVRFLRQMKYDIECSDELDQLDRVATI
jgi:hypothetical protein